MAILIDLPDYRVETYQQPFPKGQKLGVPMGKVRIIRRHDGHFIENEQDSDFAFGLLWEVAHGVPKAEIEEWVQEWIKHIDADCGAAGGNDGHWQKPEARELVSA